MKRCLVSIVMAIILMAVPLLAACGEPAPTVKVITWKLDTHMPATADPVKMAQWFCDEVYERSNGRLKIDVYAGNVLGFPDDGKVAALRDNLIEMSTVGSTPFSFEAPVGNMMELPFICPDKRDVKQAVTEALFAYWEKAMDEKGGILLGVFQDVGRHLWTLDSLDKIEDIEGLKMRSMSPVEAAVLESLGAIPTTIPASELFDALQRGVVDGFGTAIPGAIDMGWSVFAKTCFEVGTMSTGFFLTASKSAFEELPADLQEIVRSTGKEWAVRCFDAAWSTEATYRTNLEEEGVVFKTASPEAMEKMRAATEKYYTEWLEKAGAVGQEMLDVANKTAAKY